MVVLDAHSQTVVAKHMEEVHDVRKKVVTRVLKVVDCVGPTEVAKDVNLKGAKKVLNEMDCVMRMEEFVVALSPIVRRKIEETDFALPMVEVELVVEKIALGQSEKEIYAVHI